MQTDFNITYLLLPRQHYKILQVTYKQEKINYYWEYRISSIIIPYNIVRKFRGIHFSQMVDF